MQGASLLVLLLYLSYVILSKNSLFSATPCFRAKADAKVRLFSQTTKLLEENFQENTKVFAFHYNAKTSTPYYIIYSYLLFPNIRSR